MIYTIDTKVAEIKLSKTSVSVQEGSATTLPDLNTILKKSYEYNVKQTVKEARKIGLRPSR